MFQVKWNSIYRIINSFFSNLSSGMQFRHQPLASQTEMHDSAFRLYIRLYTEALNQRLN